MKRTILYSVAAAAAMCLTLSFDMPKSWYQAGSAPNKYDMGVDPSVTHNGHAAATIQSNSNRIHGFGTMMQSCQPGKYLGKRVRMTGYIKSEDVKGWTGMWFRIDEAGSKKPLSFDNMYDRHISGTTDWKKCEIILNVPDNASNLAYGVLVSGKGKVWFDDIKFEIVDDNIPTTGRTRLSEPANLDFSTK